MGFDFRKKYRHHFHAGENARGVGMFYLAAVFLVGDIAALMVAGFDVPVSAIGFEHVCGVLLGVR